MGALIAFTVFVLGAVLALGLWRVEMKHGCRNKIFNSLDDRYAKRQIWFFPTWRDRPNNGCPRVCVYINNAGEKRYRAFSYYEKPDGTGDNIAFGRDADSWHEARQIIYEQWREETDHQPFLVPVDEPEIGAPLEEPHLHGL